MKLHPDKLDFQSITAYGEGWVAVNGQRHDQSLMLASSGQPQAWECKGFDELTPAHFDRLLTLSPEPPELIVFGSGAKLRFVRPALLERLIERRIGVETMDTPAACRTYNILAAEGRQVVVALLISA